ncbi:MAG: DegT/DnrJ/EryC1/StrS family aminotransferase [Coriobacteriia bacterium]|nr:DegT/DnrJ/EryC1/StrS family aminotransferase [Coriobacteriia bacterium]
MTSFVPVNEPLLDGNEKAYLAECVETGWISSEGPFVRRFEEEMAALTGRRHAVAVTNGSSALELAVELLDIGSGDEVMIPAFTIISCAAPVVRRGATPVVVDADPATWTMDVGALAPLVTPRTRAIMPVHIYGLPVDMDAVLEIARRHGLAVIEDAAEAHGLTYRGRPCGSFGDMSIFSFYPNKHVTSGEGGMLLTDDEHLAARARSKRNLCFKPERRFVHDDLGYNLRMSNLQAAVGVAQIERLPGFIARKHEMGRRYGELLADIEGLQLPAPRTEYAENDYWVYGVVLDDSVPADAREVMRRLGERGIGTRPFFYPMHLQPVFRGRGLFAGVSCPVSERLGERGFYLPSGLALTEAQMERVAGELRAVLEDVRTERG